MAKEVPPIPPGFEDLQSDGERQAVIDQRENNVTVRLRTTIIIIIFIAIVSVIVGVLTLMGSASNDYSYVAGLDTLARGIAYFSLAIGLGGLVAYRAAHSVHYEPTSPRQPRLKLRAAGGLLIFGGFVAGIIPGIIWAAIITYPLSHQACVLSGSKYC